jgi:hypothetical protein
MSAPSVPVAALSESPGDRDLVAPGHVLPAWLLSLMLHFGVVISGALLLRAGALTSAGQGISNDGRGGEIVLVANSNNSDKPYLAEEDFGGSATGDESASADMESPGGVTATEDSAPIIPGVGLPKAVTSSGAAKATTNATSAAGATSRLGPRAGKGGSAATSVFGAIGEGQRFMYVFDRSSSMSGAAISAAKRELNQSLTHLGDIHQFGIVFYNHNQTTYGHTSGSGARMYFAKKENRVLAERFVSSISAQGATDHLPALKIALEARPDVVFFLTDADDPVLTAAELQKVKSLNAGTIINTIQFGYGPKQNFDNFLEQLSADSGGMYRYVDVTQLARAK